MAGSAEKEENPGRKMLLKGRGRACCPAEQLDS